MTRVFGIYFAVANAIALALQLGWVGRVLGRGALPLLNSGWALFYVVAQAGLVWLPPDSAPGAGGSEHRRRIAQCDPNPRGNLLYDVLPLSQQPRSRTLVIGVALPAATFLGGLSLTLLGPTSERLGILGVSAALILLVATLVQNRLWIRANTGASDKIVHSFQWLQLCLGRHTDRCGDCRFG